MRRRRSTFHQARPHDAILTSPPDPGGRFPIKAWTKGVQVEEVAADQLRNIANMPFIHKHVAVMPDCHWGMGATIGSVIPTEGAIIPAAVPRGYEGAPVLAATPM